TSGAGGFEGIGFVFAPDDRFCGIDLDGSIIDGQIVAGAQAIIDAFATYTEISPSGKGVKLFLTGTKPQGVGCARVDVDGFARIEMYDTARFFTVTGRHLDSPPTAIVDGQRQLDELCARLWPKASVQAAPIAEHVEHGLVDTASRERRYRAYLEKCPDAI